MHYRYRNFYVYVEANNVLNVRYFDIGGLEQAGIWVTAGVKYKFVFDKNNSLMLMKQYINHLL